MRIEVLYVPGCPNYEPAVERLQAVLESQSLQAEIRSVPISSEDQAKALLFPGSPTIRIDGKDVEQHETVAPSPCLSAVCKPQRCSFRRDAANRDFKRETERVKIPMRVAERATPVAAVIAVLSTLSCCLPLTFLGALGLAGVSVWLQSLRPWFLVSAAILLGVGFIQLYAQRGRCQKRSTLSIALFRGAVLIVLLVILFPQVIANLIAG